MISAEIYGSRAFTQYFVKNVSEKSQTYIICIWKGWQGVLGGPVAKC
jgi:hypothetical protein